MVTFLLFSTSSFVSAQSTPAISNLMDCAVQGWSTKRLPKSSFELVPGPSGCSAQFTIRGDQPKISDGWRAELSDPLLVPLGSEMTYEFETYIPSSSARDELAGMVIAQWHDIIGYEGGRPQRPPVSVRIRGDEMRIELWNNEHLLKDAKAEGIPVYSMKHPFDRWIKIQMHVKWSDDASGFLNLKIDGNPVATYTGNIGYASDFRAPYFKFGVYTVHPFDGTLKVYHRGYSRKVLFNPEAHVE